MSDIIIDRINNGDLNDCNFLQLLKLLDHLGGSLNKKLKVRFIPSYGFKFPENDIEKITLLNNDRKEIGVEITINFLSLFGVTGVLPSHYTEYIQECKKYKDTTLLDFTNIFTNKLIKLFAEIIKLANLEFIHSDVDRQISYLSLFQSLIGVMPAIGSKLVPDKLLAYAGILTQVSRSEIGLRIILSNFLGYPIEIEQFVREKIALNNNQLSQLGSSNSILGLSLYLGRNAYFNQSKIVVKVLGLNFTDYSKLIQDDNLQTNLKQIVNFYLDRHISYELIFVVLDQEKVTSLKCCAPRRLGIDVWCKG